MKLIKRFLRQSLALMVIVLPCFALGDGINSSWLEVKEGAEDSSGSFKVESVEVTETGKKVMVSFTGGEAEDIEEVVVTGVRTSLPDRSSSQKGYRVAQREQIEFINDVESGRTGIIIHLGKEVQFKLHINYFNYNAF